MRKQLTRFSLSAAMILFLACATPVKQVGKGLDPQLLFAKACAPGISVRSVKGAVKMSAKSHEASGQFPAQVDVTADKLYLEITNLLGGTEATITVDHGNFVIDSTKQKNGGIRQGSGSWGGIPLRWAPELFLGRIPCPSLEDQKSAHALVNADGELVYEKSGEKYVYRFRESKSEPWPDFLHWELDQRSIDFKFDDPEDETLSPRKWEAKSEQGEVKVRWRDRDVVR